MSLCAFTVPIVTARRYRRTFRKRKYGRTYAKRRKQRRRRAGKRQWGGVVKFGTRFPGGRRVTQVPFPQVYFTKHAYRQTVNNTNIAAFTLFAYQPSSLFNVDLLGDDAGFAAALDTFWTTYVVLGYSYEVTFSSRENGDDLQMYVVPWPFIDDPTTSSNMEYRAGAKVVMIGPNASGDSVKSIRGYVNTSSLVGVKLVNEATFWGSGSTEPTVIPQLYCGISNNLGSTTTGTFKIALNIYVKWFNRKDAGTPALSALTLGPAHSVEDHIMSLKRHVDNMELVVASKAEKRLKCVEGKCVVE